MTPGVTASAASRWILALAVTAPLVLASPAAAARAVHPADYVTIDTVADCDNPMALTNSVVWTVRNGNDVAVEIEGLTQVSSLGTRVWQPGQTESVITSGIDPGRLWNSTISATVGVKLPGDAGSRFVVKDVVVPNCLKDKPIITFAESCMNVDVSMVLPSDADWPFAVRILVGTSGGQHSVHILNPGERKTISVPSYAGNRVSAVNASYGPIAEHHDLSTRPCSSGNGSSSGGGGSSVGSAAVVPALSADATASPTTDASSAASSPVPVSSGNLTPDAAQAAVRPAGDTSWWTTMLLALAGTLVGAVILSGAAFAVLQRRSRYRSPGAESDTTSL